MKIQKSQASAPCRYFEEEEVGNANGGYIKEPIPAYCLKFKEYIYGEECKNCKEVLNVNSI